MQDDERGDLGDHNGQEPDDPKDHEMPKIERLLQGLKPGYSVSVYRVRPSWCKGWLERLDLIDGEDIDMGYLAETWGGEVLRLRVCDDSGTYRGGVDIPMMSYKPRKHGKLLRRRHWVDDTEDDPRSARTQTTAPPPVHHPPEPANGLESMLKLLKQTRAEDIKTFRDLLGAVPVEPKAVGTGLDSIAQMAQQFKELKALFGEFEQPAAAQDDQTQMFQAIGEIAKAITHKAPVRQLPPQQKARIIRNEQTVPPRPPAQAVPNPGDNPRNPHDLSTELASLGPQGAADVAMHAMATMTEEERAAVIGDIMTRLPELQELEFEDGEEIEYYEDDEPNAPTQLADASKDADPR